MELVIVGCQSGDEGKGKITDFLSVGAYAVVRFQGGPHTGHTVVTSDGVFRFVQLPAGVLQGAIGVLGNGCVVDPGNLLDEIEALQTRGISAELKVSEIAHIVMPYHLMQDEAMEEWRGETVATSAATGFNTGGGQLGSTKKGVGPCREDKISRIGIRLIDLIDKDLLHTRLLRLIPMKRNLIQNVFGVSLKSIDALNVDILTDKYHGYGLELKKYMCDVSVFLDRARKEHRYVLYEGAQSIGLDIEHGTYPYVSTGYSAASGVTVGTGSPPNVPFHVVGVAKAYMVQSGGGPLPTEFGGDAAEYVISRGKEFGTVTGRRRRVGWFDLPFVRKSVRIDGLEHLCLMNIDVLAGLPEIKVATQYSIRGDRVSEFPTEVTAMANIQPVYRTFEGWEEQDWATVAKRGVAALPKAVRVYTEFIAESLGVPLSILSLGRDRHETILLRSPHPTISIQ